MGKVYLGMRCIGESYTFLFCEGGMNRLGEIVCEGGIYRLWEIVGEIVTVI